MTVPVDTDLSITCLQSHFIAPGMTDKPLIYQVDRVKTSPSSALRSIRVLQENKTIILSTASFSKIKSSSRPAIKHSAERQVKTPLGGWTIRLDDFEKTEAGATGIRGERLPVNRSNLCQLLILFKSYKTDMQLMIAMSHLVASPATAVVPILLQMAPSSVSFDISQAAKGHILVLAGLSDLYVLDSPLTAHGLSYGIPAIGDHSRTFTKPDTDFLTSTSHTIYFHLHEGFRTDKVLQVEVHSPWASNGRVFIESRIFHGDGQDGLVATCIQEVSYSHDYVLPHGSLIDAFDSRE